MFFNSQTFLFVFLPITLVAVWLALRFQGRRAGMCVLALASLVFYAQMGLQAVPIIACSIIGNYALAAWMASIPPERRYPILVIGVALNITALAYYKYWNFVAANLNHVGLGLRIEHIILPLAISFYTFQQIAFLVDTYRGQMHRVPFLNYCVSVLFFPHLIAGPLIHYERIMEQFSNKFEISSITLWAGLPIFTMGLAKKVFIADGLAEIVSPIYKAASAGGIELISAWVAALGYTAQLYFDFSGYSDMAIGLGLMFGIALPVNFFSPYKATSIIEFWRRWHITLSGFLRDYLYIPMGGSRHGVLARYRNLFLTMLIGGLWHGAGWTFVIWGALHGGYLVINHAWRSIPLPRSINATLTPVNAVLTFGAIIVGWVFFRAADVQTALNILSGMVGMHGAHASAETGWMLSIGPSFAGIAFDGHGLPMRDMAQVSALLVLGYALIFFAPNSVQIFGLDGYEPRWVASLSGRAALTGALAWVAGFSIFAAAPSEFLYFRF